MPRPPTVYVARPQAGQDPGLVVRYLRGRERRLWARAVSAIVGGAVVSLVGPLIITLFFYGLSSALVAAYGFWGAYRIVAAVSLPVLFLLAARLKGSVLEATVSDGDSLSGRFFRRKIAPLLVLAEVATVGPRLVLWGARTTLHRRRLGRVDLSRAADAVVVLAKVDAGVKPAQLLQPGEPAGQLEPLLGLLLYHEVVDLALRGDRVWLTSDAKRALARTK